MKKVTLIVIFITLLSKILGFLREFVLGYYYGASAVSDAYIISNTIPSSIIAFIGVAIASVFLPKYTLLKEESVFAAHQFTNKVLTLLLIFFLVIIVGSVYLTPHLVKVFAFGFEDSSYELAVTFTRITFVSTIFFLFIPIIQSLLNNEGKYYYSSFSGFPLNLIVILSIIASFYFSYYILAVGFVLGSIFQFLFLYFFARKINFRFRLQSFIGDANIKGIMFLALPVFFGVAVNQINLIVDRSLASMVTIGGVSAMNYANKINWLIQGAFSVTIATVFFTEASKIVSEKKIISKKLIESFNDLHLFIIPFMVLCIMFPEEIISILFVRGNFDEAALNLTAGPLMYYALGFIGFSYREIISRTFYLLGNTRVPFLTALFGTILNVILNIVLVKFMGLSGLAFATSISAFSSSILMILILKSKKYNVNLYLMDVIKSSLKYGLLFCVPLAIISIIINRFELDKNENFLFISFFSILIYLGILIIKNDLPIKYLIRKNK